MFIVILLVLLTAWTEPVALTTVLQNVRKEFDGFEKLYGRFLQETGPSIEWDKIKLLPDQAVSARTCRSVTQRLAAL